MTNQITRNKALKVIDLPAYDLNNIENDIEYFLKKMEWTREHLDNYLQKKEISHKYYGSEIKLWKFFTFLFNLYNIKK